MSDYLPEEILRNILARLPVKTLMQFRCVSKTWHSLISSPNFITHHLNKAAIRNNDLLFFKCMSKDGSQDRFFLYPDKDFLRCRVEDLVFPLDMLYSRSPGQTDLVGSCNGLFFVRFLCLNQCGVYKAVLWNPSIRKTVPIPEPIATFHSDDFFHEHFGFGFDSINHDYKLVRVVYLFPRPYIRDKKQPPLVEVYSMKSGCWRMVDNDLKCFINKYSLSSAFVSGACHWAANKWGDDLNVIVFFNLADEKIGEMTVPDNYVVSNIYLSLTVTVFDGFLSLIASSIPSSSIWAMKKYGDSQSWIKLFNIEHLKGWVIPYFVGCKDNGEMFLFEEYSDLISYDKTKNRRPRIWERTSLGFAGSFYLDSYTESLVLLNEAEASTTLNDGASGNEASSASKEHSSHVADLDKNKMEKEKIGTKNMENPETVDEENRVLEGDDSSSGATSHAVIYEGNGTSIEYDFGAKKRKLTEKNVKNNMESDYEEVNELPGKHNCTSSADTDENEAHEAPKEVSSSGSNTDKKKGRKQKKGNNNE